MCSLKEVRNIIPGLGGVFVSPHVLIFDIKILHLVRIRSVHWQGEDDRVF